MRLLLALALISSLAGCSDINGELAKTNVPAGPPAWRQGYVAGCQTSMDAHTPGGKLVKDFARYKGDDLYKQGWDDGLQLCHTG